MPSTPRLGGTTVPVRVSRTTAAAAPSAGPTNRIGRRIMRYWYNLIGTIDSAYSVSS